MSRNLDQATELVSQETLTKKPLQQKPPKYYTGKKLVHARSKTLALLSIPSLLLLVLPLLVHPACANMMHTLPEPPPTENAYIREDGSIEPSTLPITRAKRTYTFTGDIFNYTLEIQCNDIVIDGAGFTLTGVDDYAGITLRNRHQVTIRNLNITQFGVCISLIKSSGIIITENSMSHSTGVEFDDSSHCHILRNNMSNSISGSAFSNTIAQNTFVGGCVQIGGDDNTISENSFKDTGIAVQLFGSHGAKRNIIANNTIEGGGGGDGVNLSADAILNKIYGNSITGKSCGIRIRCAHDNTVYENYFANNTYGIYLENPKRFENIHAARSFNNTFFHNNLTDNTENVHIETTAQGETFPNRWNIGEKGNYWSDYTGTDADEDDIGDVPYIIDANNTDNSPFCTRAPTPTPAPADLTSVPITVFAAASVAVAAAGLLVYSKKRKRTDEQL